MSVITNTNTEILLKRLQTSNNEISGQIEMKLLTMKFGIIGEERLKSGMSIVKENNIYQLKILIN
nr:hypothetical protein [Lysinibacillus timonensis]